MSTFTFGNFLTTSKKLFALSTILNAQLVKQHFFYDLHYITTKFSVSCAQFTSQPLTEYFSQILKCS